MSAGPVHVLPRHSPPNAAVGGAGDVSALLDADDIAALLPHREPFSFLRWARLEGPREIVGMAEWPAGHPILAAHFPGYPVVPGVCLVEAAAQLAGIAMMCLRRTEPSAAGPGDALGVLGEIRSARFSAVLAPDTPVRLHATLRCVMPALWTANARGVRSSWVGDIPQAPREAEVFRCELVIGMAARP